MKKDEQLEELVRLFPFHNRESIKQAFYQNNLSREVLTIVTPKAFEALAKEINHGSINARDVQTNLRALVLSGEAFESIPVLILSHDSKGSANVIGHEGRNRFKTMEEMGATAGLVVINCYDPNGIRWGQQHNEESYDYIKAFPWTLESENGVSYDFPIERTVYKDNIFARVLDIVDGQLVSVNYENDKELLGFVNPIDLATISETATDSSFELER